MILMIKSDSRYLPLADKSVQCVVTSPPYWGLRDYGLDSNGIGLEKTPEEYVNNMVQVFREVKRVLRDDGVVWLNLGDSYASDVKGSGGPSEKQLSNAGSRYKMTHRLEHGLKPKDLVGIPWRVAFALQADGWYLRSDIIWSKPNPMPESVTDRPTKAHEYVFLLTKSARYFYDADAVREEGKGYGRSNWNAQQFKGGDIRRNHGGKGAHGKGGGTSSGEGGRNLRSVWTITTQPFSGQHFAVFPEKLVEPCIKAGTSEKGCCPECGGPWVRVVEKSLVDTEGWGPAKKDHTGTLQGSQSVIRDGKGRAGTSQVLTIGWRPTCSHNLEPVPCLVLDPFGGSGTVARVALRLRRRTVHCDLAYHELAKDTRMRNIQVEMF
jgi:DNA modification methylase